MKSSKNLLPCSIGTAVVIVGSLMLCGLINKFAFGGGSKLLTECQIPQDEGILRLYTTHGSSVTTADWWKVTYQTSKSKESTIFSSYSSPGIKDIECAQDEVIFIFYPDEHTAIPISWIKEELIFKPVSFYKSELKSLEYQEEVSTWKGVYP
jgi:hypothetical protein